VQGKVDDAKPKLLLGRVDTAEWNICRKNGRMRLAGRSNIVAYKSFTTTGVIFMQSLQLDDFKNYCFIDNLTLSPNGKNIALLGRKANKDNDYDVAIFVDKGSGFEPLTGLEGKVEQFLWIDDENILFCEVRSEEDRAKIEKGYELTCYYSINIHKGEAVPAFKVNAVVINLMPLENGNFLAVTIFDNARPCFEGKSEHEINEILLELKKETHFQVIDELPFWADGRGITNKKRIRLNILTEEGLKPITRKLTNVVDYKLSPCKKYAAYICDPAPAEIRSLECNIHIVNLETFEEKEVLEEPKRIRAFDFWGDKMVVAFAQPGQRRYEHGPFYIVDPKSKQTKELAKFDLSLGESGESDSKFCCGITSKVVGDSYFFTSLSGYYTDIFELNLNSGKISNITNSKATVEYFDIKNGRVVAGVMQPCRLVDVFELKDGKLEGLSSFNTELLSTRKYSPPEHFTFKDAEGSEIDGWVIKPIDYEKGKKYPAILNIHGGPKCAYTDSYYHEMQYWASQNYFVIFGNPRGSDGKGNEFADISGKYGTIDYDNLMQLVDESIKRYPGIDENNLGVTGGSYGGFMTSWIVGHTNRFKAAVSQCSISNWVSFYCISDIGYYYGSDQMKADPWTNVDKLWWHSPLKYAPNVKTPTLVLHSCEDFRCCIPEAYQWYTALKLHGVETRLVIFHGENHEMPRSGKPDYRARRLKEITGWMDKYLKS